MTRRARGEGTGYRRKSDGRYVWSAYVNGVRKEVKALQSNNTLIAARARFAAQYPEWAAQFPEFKRTLADTQSN